MICKEQSRNSRGGENWRKSKGSSYEGSKGVRGCLMSQSNRYLFAYYSITIIPDQHRQFRESLPPAQEVTKTTHPLEKHPLIQLFLAVTFKTNPETPFLFFWQNSNQQANKFLPYRFRVCLIVEKSRWFWTYTRDVVTLAEKWTC